MLKSLIHNGIIIPPPPEYMNSILKIRGKSIELTHLQEEMALAWARKIGTPYVDDLVFVKNFMRDFSAALRISPILKVDEVDFTPLIKFVEAERERKANMSKDEKKLLAAKRKEIREELKEKYGHATADGERIELANYMTEPSGIFMGRGKHPLRGKWKAGAQKSDVTLNLSPEALVPDGDWKEVVWQPESLWVARWEDKLSGKLKYIWLHDTAPIKQEREAKKFDKATELNTKIDLVRAHIQKGLSSDNFKTRKVATACHLIDALCLRVGDEKDPEEADTVGATTLRPEHIKIHDDGIVEFKFLGKDSVLWHKKIQMSEVVRKNLKELSEKAKPSTSAAGKKVHSAYLKPQLFPDISSRNVNAYLSQAMDGLSAKVFRTHHASHVVKDSLESSNVVKADPEYKKWEATVKANMEAAILCNHTKQPPKNWSERKKKYAEREKNANKRIKDIKELIKKLKTELSDLKTESKVKRDAAKTPAKRKEVKARFDKRIEAKKARIEATLVREEKAIFALGKLKAQKAIASENRTWNLGTSQKSYIDPRVYHNWGKEVDYDVIEKYYSNILKRKFQWVKANDPDFVKEEE